MQFFSGSLLKKNKLKKESLFVLDIPNTCAIQQCGCGFLLVQSAAAAVRLRDEGEEESKAMVMALPASPFLPPSLEGEGGRRGWRMGAGEIQGFVHQSSGR